MLIDETIFEATVQRDAVDFHLADGRRVCVPIENFPKLQAAGRDRCGEPTIAPDGLSVAWPAIGETVTVAHVLTRRRTGAAGPGRGDPTTARRRD